jgi:DNA processing protein
MQEFKKYEIKINDIDFPERLKSMPQFPSKLRYIGHPVWKTTNCLSVVGSRHPSDVAQSWLDETLSLTLQASAITIVSGGARGIDQVAHKVALRSSRPTVVFLPSGLDCPYPNSLSAWFPTIIKNGGAIISHLPDNETIKKHHFIIRNQWIAGISRSTLLVEARKKSGTYMTGNYALHLGRNLGVMPTYPNSLGAGGLDFINSGANIIRDHLDLLLFC